MPLAVPTVWAKLSSFIVLFAGDRELTCLPIPSLQHPDKLQRLITIENTKFMKGAHHTMGKTD